MTPLNPEEIAICDGLFFIPFYPERFHDIVLEDISAFAGPEKRAERLRWLVSTARTAMKERWIDDLRGLWCTRFQIADGIEADCCLAGHTPADIETESLQRHARQIEGQKALPAGRPETLQGLQGLLSGARVKKLAPEENYSPPEWLKNL